MKNRIAKIEFVPIMEVTIAEFALSSPYGIHRLAYVQCRVCSSGTAGIRKSPI